MADTDGAIRSALENPSTAAGLNDFMDRLTAEIRALNAYEHLMMLHYLIGYAPQCVDAALKARKTAIERFGNASWGSQE